MITSLYTPWTVQFSGSCYIFIHHYPAAIFPIKAAALVARRCLTQLQTISSSVKTLHMDIVRTSRGWTLPLLACFRCLFSAPLGSSCACGSIDKHSWLCNCALWNAKAHTHCEASPLTAPDSRHIFGFKTTRSKICTTQFSFERKTSAVQCTPLIPPEKYEWSSVKAFVYK